MDFDWIQKHVLLYLLRVENAKVSKLKPKDMPDNAFSYHLKKLVKADIIAKETRGTYKLTDKGQFYVGKISTANNSNVDEIKTVVMLYGKIDNKYLFFQWSRQPYLGMITPLYDRMPFGKSLTNGQTSACFDKLGNLTEFRYLNTALIKIFKNNALITHMNAIIYRIDISKKMLPFKSKNGVALLLSKDNTSLMSGVGEFINNIEELTEPFESEWNY